MANGDTKFTLELGQAVESFELPDFILGSPIDSCGAFNLSIDGVPEYAHVEHLAPEGDDST